jgi:hypothetical protein
MVTLREPALGVLAQAPISALNATQVAVKGKRTRLFFRAISSVRSASVVLAAILFAVRTSCHQEHPEQT